MTPAAGEATKWWGVVGKMPWICGAFRSVAYRVVTKPANAAARRGGDIRTAQRLGFSLAEIGESLPALWNSSMPQKDIAALLLQKMTVIDRKIEELIGLKKELSERLAQTCPLVGVNEA
jgi:hypothetical protein